MEFFNIVRLEVIAAIVFLFVVIFCTLRNQKRVWRNLLCFIFAIAIVGVPLYFDLGGVFTKCLTFLNAGVFKTMLGLVKVEATAELIQLLDLLAVFVAIGLVELLLVGICALIGGSDRRKFAKYPSYATIFRPIGGFIGGLIRGAIVVCGLYVLWTFVSKASGIDVSTDHLVNLLKGFDFITEKITALFAGCIA